MPQQTHIAAYALDASTHVVEVDGQIDLYSAPGVQDKTLRASNNGQARVILDLTRVTFIDSAGLGVLIAALRRLRGDLALVVTDYDIERLFEISGLAGTFAVYRSCDDAYRFFMTS